MATTTHTPPRPLNLRRRVTNTPRLPTDRSCVGDTAAYWLILAGMQSRFAHCDHRCHAVWVRRSDSRVRKVARIVGLQHERKPTPGLEPGTPSLRVKCSTS